VVTAPVLGLAALAIRVASRGPVVFKQRRVGLGGREIVVYKLRTMHVDAERVLDAYLSQNADARDEYRHYGRLVHDPRVLPIIGRLLRRTSVDELPQLLNVLKGDMSLVGPRPLEPHLHNRYSARHRTRRESVRPGVTGLWQVSGRGDTDLDALERIDEDYIERCSLWLDLAILARTPRAVLLGRGAY
jgi:lipopolysaccharide/colanic/teichoic acid biosynthesis glycosyltransferase